MFERFTKEARAVVIGAQEEARTLGHGEVGSEHLMLALLHTPDAPGAATLTHLGVTAGNCRAATTALWSPGDSGPLGPEDAEALRAIGIDLEEIRRRTEATFGPGALDAPGPPADDSHGADRPGRPGPFGRRRERGGVRRPGAGHVAFTRRAKKALELSLQEALALRDNHIGTAHLTLGLLCCEDRSTLALLERLGIERLPVRDLVLADHRSAV